MSEKRSEGDLGALIAKLEVERDLALKRGYGDPILTWFARGLVYGLTQALDELERLRASGAQQ